MKVSVCMIAYNAERFIEQAIESVMVQKTDFDFELVIGDDGSRDNTEQVCRRMVEKYPGRIRYNRRSVNIGMMPNFIQTLGECRGEYIAICEGDDYWVDENKLQIQADKLDTHPQHSMCCHNHFVEVHGHRRQANPRITSNEVIVNTEDYLLDPFFHMTSYFFRRNAMPAQLPAWYRDVLAGDHFLVLFISMKGSMLYLNRAMSVFRNHASSVSFTKGALTLKENFVKHLRLFDQYSRGAYHDVLKRVIRKWDIVYKVYEPGTYFSRLGYLSRNLGFYLSNFRQLEGLKLVLRYMLPRKWLTKLQSKPSIR